MKFNLIQPISCGNAVRLVVQPTANETRWRILRKEINDFTGWDDQAAFLVHDGAERFLTDARLLSNGTQYYYAIYGLTALGWSAPVLASVTPSSTFTDASVDAQELVRERIEVTLHSMIQRGLVRLSKPSVAVMSIPFYQQGTDLPVVTVLFGGGAAVAHGLGEQVSSDEFDGDDWIGYQGWHQSVALEISVWSLNAEERNVMRMALQAAIAANLGILETLGLNMVEVQSVQDSEDATSMNAPIYQTVIRVGCQMAVAVADVDGSMASSETVLIGV